MKKNKYLVGISILCLLSFLFACKKTETSAVNRRNLGFIEYQYSDNTVTPAKLVYKRFTLNKASFNVWAKSTLPTALSSKYRQVELFLFSDEASYGTNPQPVGASTVQISLIDTTSSTVNTATLLPYGYNLVAGLSGFTSLSILKPSCVGLNANLNRLSSGNTSYEFSFSGQTQKIIQVLRYTDGTYQIIANGAADGKVYNLSYVGEIARGSDY